MTDVPERQVGSAESVAQGQQTRWRLGGSSPPIEFSMEETATMAAMADAIIPPGKGFPAPSKVRVAEDFVPRYVARDDAKVVYFPFVRESEIKGALRDVSQKVEGGATVGDILAAYESETPELFQKLRNLVYFGYYSRPPVVGAIQQNLEAGKDYRVSPQPYGYLDVIEEWEPDLDPGQTSRGSYTPTEDVQPLGWNSAG